MAWIFLIGPAAAGKTTFGLLLQAMAPHFCAQSDVEALLELASIQSDGHPSRNNPRYWPDFSSDPVGSNSWLNGAITPLSSTSFEIVNPRVWDEALLRSVRHVIERDDVVFEFSRGTDHEYCVTYDIAPEDVYHHVFEALMDSFPILKQRPVSIVHISAPFDIRCIRNAARANAGERFVAHDAFRRLYNVDTFRFLRSSSGANSGILSEDLPLPVFSLENVGELTSTLKAFRQCIVQLTHQARSVH